MLAIDTPRNRSFMLEQLTESSSALVEHQSRRAPDGRDIPRPGDFRDPKQNMHEQDGVDVQTLFARHANGETYAAIARDLNRRGIPARRGARWYTASVWMLLHRP